MTEQIEPKSKQELLETIQVERCHLDNLIGTLTEAQLVEPDIDGDRCVKDIIVHITIWEQRMIQWINESYAGIAPQRPAPGMNWDDLDKINEQYYLEHKDDPLTEIMSESSTSYAQAFRVIEEMKEQDLFDGSRFAWRKGDPIWHMVAANTCWHYKEHRDQIEAWKTSIT